MEEGRQGLAHVRAIDGVRGVAVVLVLAFHGEVPGFSGGFLGVSVFFTLSGYLITQLLVREHDRHGRISLRAFWGRRLRRLAPASLVALATIAVVVVATDVFPGAAVPGDVAAAALDVANWRFAVVESSYADLFSSGPSPVLHFWSLAIEEQFYLLFPLLVVVVLTRLGRRRLPVVLTALALAGTAAAMLAPTDLAYYGTHTRAPELLVGALLALVLPIGRDLPAPMRRALSVAGVAAAAGIALLVAHTTVASSWLYHGGLPAVSLLSATLIASATIGGPVQTAASWRPVVEVGRLSYGIYVYHWPLFLVLSEERLGLDGGRLLAVRLAATLAVAWLSAVLLENPVRRRALVIRAPSARLTFAGALAIVLLLAVMARPTPAARIVPDPDEALVSFSPPPAVPVVDVLVLGSVPDVVGWVEAVRPDGVELRVRSALRTDCPLRLPDRDDAGCVAFARMATAPVPAPAPDLVVVGVGAAERVELADELVRMAPGSPEAATATVEALEVSDVLVQTMLDALPAVPVLLVDTARDAILSKEMDLLALRARDVTVSRASEPMAFERDLLGVLSTLDVDAQVRILVVGDSTSYQLATALDAASQGRVEVVWAGRANCALVPATRTRWYAGAEFDGAECPSAERVWPDAVARLRPDIVLAAASLSELAAQQYGEGAAWEDPGAPAYQAAHDRAMEALQAMLQADGVLTVVATTPPLVPARAFGGPLSDPTRLSAWLDQLTRWDEQWTSVGTVDWAAISARAEADAGHDLRIDAVHFEAEPLARVLGPRLLAELLAVAERLEAEARAGGCLTGSGADRALVLARCRSAG